jgi:hypothetical protein
MEEDRGLVSIRQRGLQGEECGMRGADIEIGGNAGVYPVRDLCRGAFASQAMQGFSVGSQPGRRDPSGRRSARLSGTEIDQRGYNHKGEGKDSCQAAKQMEIVSMEGLKFKKCVGDLVATEGRAFFVMEGSS